MTLGLYEDRARRRRKRRWTAVKWMTTFGVLVALGLLAYRTGTTLAERRVVALEEELTAREAELAELQTTVADLRGEVTAARERLAEAEQRYRRDVPTGDLAALSELIGQRLAEGIAADRLQFLITSAQNERDCDDQPQVKRFIVRTPLYAGGDDSVSFANNAITVTASGASAADPEGRQEAWYDVGKPITAHFTLIGGRTAEATGRLPLHHSVVVGDREHRFTLVPGDRGFVQISGDSCSYP